MFWERKLHHDARGLTMKLLVHVLVLTSAVASSGSKVWFEPTDIKKATLPFRTKFAGTIKFISPNFNELKTIAQFLGIRVDMGISVSNNDKNTVLQETVKLSYALADHVNTIITTLGKLGIMIATNGETVTSSLITKVSSKQSCIVRLYETPIVSNILNVSGAGDCFAAGFIAAMLLGIPEAKCVHAGFKAARLSLKSSSAVPEALFDIKEISKSMQKAEYVTL